MPRALVAASSHRESRRLPPHVAKWGDSWRVVDSAARAGRRSATLDGCRTPIRFPHSCVSARSAPMKRWCSGCRPRACGLATSTRPSTGSALRHRPTDSGSDAAPTPSGCPPTSTSATRRPRSSGACRSPGTWPGILDSTSAHLDGNPTAGAWSDIGSRRLTSASSRSFRWSLRPRHGASSERCSRGTISSPRATGSSDGPAPWRTRRRSMPPSTASAGEGVLAPSSERVGTCAAGAHPTARDPASAPRGTRRIPGAGGERADRAPRGSHHPRRPRVPPAAHDPRIRRRPAPHGSTEVPPGRRSPQRAGGGRLARHPHPRRHAARSGHRAARRRIRTAMMGASVRSTSSSHPEWRHRPRGRAKRGDSRRPTTTAEPRSRGRDGRRRSRRPRSR